jgi:hypothetical protein
LEHTFDTVDQKTAEAEFFLQEMVSAARDIGAFQFYLSSYLSASRTITLALQRFSDIPGFSGWYEPHRQRLRHDPVAKYFLEARNHHVHGGPIPIRNAVFHDGRAEYFFAKLPEASALSENIVAACRQHFISLLEIILSCYEVLGVWIDPQQHYTKEHFVTLGRGIVEAECEVWGFERTSLVEEGYDEDARWRELRSELGSCEINHLFYSYLGKPTPQPVEPEHYADFDFTPEEKGWNHIPAGFASLRAYWDANPARVPDEERQPASDRSI